MIYANLGVNEQAHLTVAGHDVTELAAQYGTPLMLLDESVIRSRCRIYRQAIAESFPAGSMALYASKALCIKAMYPILQQEGLGADVVSSGELYTALQAGFPAGKLFFHGNSKTDFDIRFAIEQRIGYFVCDSAEELAAVSAEAVRQGVVQKLLLRLAPGIDAHTHEKINTGRVDSKFGAGIETGQAEALLLQALKLPNICVCGFHCHIGSQIFEHTPFCDAAVMMLEFISQMEQAHGFHTQLLNLGGGMGVPYVASDPTIDYAANIRCVGQLVKETCDKLGIASPAILMEPGRSIVADAGVTLYTVGATKIIPGFLSYVSMDGGMTDNPRYTLYDADYTVLAADRMDAEVYGNFTVAGRCCESGDLIQRDVPLPLLKRGDLLAVLTTGAYNYSMASNYNRICRPAVVMLGNGEPRPVVRRETFEDLLRNDL